jgi:hypothetical protein
MVRFYLLRLALSLDLWVFQGDSHPKELSHYVHDLTEPMGHHLKVLTVALSYFVEVGVPTIR